MEKGKSLMRKRFDFSSEIKILVEKGNQPNNKPKSLLTVAKPPEKGDFTRKYSKNTKLRDSTKIHKPFGTNSSQLISSATLLPDSHRRRASNRVLRPVFVSEKENGYRAVT